MTQSTLQPPVVPMEIATRTPEKATEPAREPVLEVRDLGVAYSGSSAIGST